MTNYGLYLPKIFNRQIFENTCEIPFEHLKNNHTFVSIDYLRNLHFKNQVEFTNLTNEMVLRGGQFISDSKSLVFPGNEIKNKKVLLTTSETPVDAYKKLDLYSYNIGYIQDAFNIKNNQFFTNIPLDGFKVLGMTNRDIQLFERSLISVGFRIYETNADMLDLPKQMYETSNQLNKSKTQEGQIKNEQNKNIKYKQNKSKDKQSNNQRKDKNKKNEKLLYYSVIQNGQKKVLPDWANFFIEIGRYINNKTNVTIYINYLDDIIPAAFISLGILNSTYKEYGVDFSLENWVRDNIKKNQIISYLYSNQSGKKEWKKAKFLSVQNLDYMPAKHNPYLLIEIDIPKEENYTQKVSINQIFEKIRVGGTTRNTAGSTVYIHDKLKNNFKKLFPSDVINTIKFTNQDYINLIGRGKKASFEKFSESFILSGSPKQGSAQFSLRDWFYFEDDQNNFSNINIINSESSRFDEDNINLFVGANDGLHYYNFKNKKNIYLVNRMNISNDIGERLSENVVKETMFNSTDVTKELIQYFSERNMEIPKGVEIFAYV